MTDGLGGEPETFKEAAPGLLRVAFVDPVRPSELAFWGRYLPAAAVAAPRTDEFGDLESLLADAEVLIGRRRRVDAALLAHAPQLRAVLHLGRLARSLDMDALEAAGVEVVAEAHPTSVGVAEHTILLMLAVYRSLPSAHGAVVEGGSGGEPRRTSETDYAYNWASIDDLRVLYRRKLGLIGFGEISRHVAERARAFGMEVRYSARSRATDGEADRLAVHCSLDDLLATADVLSIHVPHTFETEGMIGPTELGKLQSDAVVVNTSRGAVIDQDALVEALREGQIGGAGLDVFREEPLPTGHPLTRMKNVVLSPHIGGVRVETMRDPFPIIARTIERIAGETTERQDGSQE